MDREDKEQRKKSGWWHSVGRWWLMFVFLFVLGIVLLSFGYKEAGSRCTVFGLFPTLMIPVCINPFSYGSKSKGTSEKTHAMVMAEQRRRQMVKRTFFTLFWMSLIILIVSLLGVIMRRSYEQATYDYELLSVARGFMALFTMLVTGTFAHVCNQLIRSRCTMGMGGRPDEDMIIRDGIRLLWSNPFRLGLIPLFLVGVRCWRRLGSGESWVCVMTIALGILLAISFVRAILFCVRLKTQKWELRSDELVEKYTGREVRSDRVGHQRKSKHLKFKSKDTVWTTSVTDKKYYEFRVGTYSWTVYIKGKKNPLFYYDVFGDATAIDF